ncbi:hypothetical protein ACL02S_17340 [Nocardia sp. 004]
MPEVSVRLDWITDSSAPRPDRGLRGCLVLLGDAMVAADGNSCTAVQ